MKKLSKADVLNFIKTLKSTVSCEILVKETVDFQRLKNDQKIKQIILISE